MYCLSISPAVCNPPNISLQSYAIRACRDQFHRCSVDLLSPFCFMFVCHGDRSMEGQVIHC